jgi:hypothetical protein
VNEFDFQKPKKAILLIGEAAAEAGADAIVEGSAVAAAVAAAEGADEAVLEHAANDPASNIIATIDSLLILTVVSLSR